MHPPWMLGFLLALALGLAQGAAAQETEQPHAQPAEPPAVEEPVPVDVSDQDLDTFADIYANLLQAAARFEDEVSEAETLEDVEQAQERMRQDSLATIEDHGWTLDTYNSVATAINASPELTQEALRRIEERS